MVTSCRSLTQHKIQHEILPSDYNNVKWPTPIVTITQILTKNNDNGNRELVGTQLLGLLFLDQLGVWEKTGDWHVHKLLLLMLFQAWQAQPDVPVPHMIGTHGEATNRTSLFF